MYKKLTSIVLSAAMMVSVAATAAVPAYAAESKEDVSAANTINFDVKKSGWNNVKTIFCHIWKADGTGEWPAWQAKSEKCKYDSSTGIATYDLSMTGNDIKATDGKVYCVIFSANTGMQTYNSIMSGKCIGDTLYCTGNQIENPEDSEKKALEAQWENNKDCGAERKITSTGNVVGTAFPDGENDTTMMATYLIAYYNDTAKTDLVPGLLKKLNLKSDDVMKAVENKLAATANPDAAAIKSTVSKLLNNSSATVKLNKTAVTLGVGQTYALKASAAGKWSTSNSKVATVSSKGVVTAKGVGTATIKVTISNGKTAACKFTVKKAPASVTISKKSATVGVGESFAISAAITKGSVGTVTWATSNKKVAALSKGKVVAKGVGTATITVKTNNGKKATCKVVVKKAPTSVKLSKTSVTVKKGKTYTLKAALSKGAAGTVKWGTNNAKVATVSAKGVVAAKKKGTAVITVKTYNGKTAKCKVTVKQSKKFISS